MKRLIPHFRLLFNIQLVHLFSNTYETARYNMIIHVIVFLDSFSDKYRRGPGSHKINHVYCYFVN